MRARDADILYQAFDYAVDQIDAAWALQSPNYTEEERASKEEEMNQHRDVLVTLAYRALRKRVFAIRR
jgi:hypothetical protein